MPSDWVTKKHEQLRQRDAREERARRQSDESHAAAPRMFDTLKQQLKQDIEDYMHPAEGIVVTQPCKWHPTTDGLLLRTESYFPTTEVTVTMPPRGRTIKVSAKTIAAAGSAPETKETEITVGHVKAGPLGFLHNGKEYIDITQVSGLILDMLLD